MSRIHKIKKQTNNRFLNLYEVEAEHRDGTISPYYLASRANDETLLKICTKNSDPDGVVIYGVHGDCMDRLVLIRQYRYPIDGYIYEFPAGLVEPGEDIKAAAIREFYEETGLVLRPADAPADYCRPFYTTVGMTDECCGTIFGYCTGIPDNHGQEPSEDIEIVLADRAECRRILAEETVSIKCAYMLMQFIHTNGDPLAFLSDGK